MTDPAVSFVPVRTPAEIDRVVALARVIWPLHYTPIIGADGVAHMLSGFHSARAVADEIGTGASRYFLIRADGADMGYLSVRTGAGHLFLSKLYLLEEARGRGLGRRAMDFVFDRAREVGFGAIRLSVNRKNTGTIAAYERMGFRKTAEIEVDVGGGVLMQDYLMERAL